MIQFLPSRAVALAIGPLAIHWYGIMYMLGFLIGMWLIPRLEKHRSLQPSDRQREALFFAVIVGVLIGGRTGYVLFYQPLYYLHSPREIFAVWNGGMSSHGGIIGVTIALLLFARRENVNVFALADVLMVPVAIGLALGRIGNFINLELYGTVTTVPWCIHIPGVDGCRHPTQIYAVMKDLLIASVCWLHLKMTSEVSGQRSVRGRTIAMFLMLYGILRFIVEIYRDQPFGYVHLGILSLSWGQLYTIPLFLLGGGLWVWTKRNSRREARRFVAAESSKN